MMEAVKVFNTEVCISGRFAQLGVNLASTALVLCEAQCLYIRLTVSATSGKRLSTRLAFYISGNF